MNSNSVTFEIPESRLKPLVAELRESIKADCGTEYSERAIRDSVVEWLSLRLDTLFEDAENEWLVWKWRPAGAAAR